MALSQFHFNLGHEERESTLGFLIERLLRSRIKMGLRSEGEESDEDVTVYLAHLLLSVMSPVYGEQVERYTSVRNSDIFHMVEASQDNAFKYCGSFTTVTLATRQQDAGLLVEVCDTGPGLPADQLETVFGSGPVRIRSVDEGEESTQLGLSICRQIVELHRGEIGVRNNPEGGACFWFRLPTEPVVERTAEPDTPVGV